MKHSGKAISAALKLILITGILLALLLAVAFLAQHIGTMIMAMTGVLVGVWVLFILFTLYFFRDPDPAPPADKNLVIAPGHGKVDTIDTTTEDEFMGGECQRVSIFLSVFDVHVQNSPVAGRVTFLKHTLGQYLNAMRADCAKYNENVLIGFESAEPAGTKIGVRLIAGLIARRIVPFVKQDETVDRGGRMSLIQFGSRVDIYLPKNAKVKVRLGDRVVGGKTVLASFD